MIFGTDHSRDNPTYGGGHLLRELLEGKKMTVLVETDSGKTLETEAGLDEIPFARLYGTRQCFKNYAAFVNSGDEPISSIFNAIAFEPKFGGATVSGCGHLNPLKNDPLMETIGVGTRVLINGAEGFVTGKGTRSTEERPNLSGFADMHQMDPQYMGGFMTSSGPECIVSWAVPIPVLNASVLKSISVADRDIPLPVVDVVNRVPIGETTYGDVWEGTDLVVSFDPKLCLSCSRCRPEESCPTGAISFEKGVPKLDWRRCFNCGLCASACVGGTFKANLGTLSFDKREVPIILRQSDRMRAQKLAEDLKERILDGRFQLSEMSERIY
jgi:putative methanogenesis marker 16 metalloprotein